MQVMLVVEPIPGSDNDVALDALRSRWLRMGQLALRDPIRPVRKIRENRGAQLFDGRREHGYTALTRLDAAKPSLYGIGELTEGIRHVLRKRAHREHALRMAIGAAIRLHQVQIPILRQRRWNFSLATELALLRNLHH